MLLNKGVVLGAGVLSSIVIARSLGPAGRGSLAVAVALTAILAQVGSLGFQTANPYFSASRGISAQRLKVNSLWLAATAGAVLILAAAGLKLLIPSAVAGVTWLELAIAAATVPPMLASLFLQGILLGEGRMLAYNLVEAAFAVGALVVLLIVSAAWGLTVASALAVVLAWHSGAAASFLSLVRGRGPRRLLPDLGLLAQMATYGIRIYATGLIAYAVIRIDVLLVNGMLGASEAGYYALSVALLDMLYVLPLVVAVNLFARIARGTGIETTALVFRVVAPFYAAACLAAALLAGTIFEVLYGPEFAPSTELFWWLAPGAFFTDMLNILSYHFAGRGYPRRIVLYWCAGLVLNVALNVALLPSEGTYIAAMATSITYAVLLALLARMFAQEAGSMRVLVTSPRELVRVVRGFRSGFA